jgi:hypothetical protein
MSLGTSHFFMLRHHRVQHITIPFRINHIVILTTQAQSSVFLRYDYLVFKSFKKIELQAGGTHFCICNMPAMAVHRAIETMDRVFSQHQHPQEDILILLETAHSDTAVPRLWDSCAMALLIQGVTHCDLELAFPLFTLKTIHVSIKSYDSVLNEIFYNYSQSNRRFVQTCACHATHQDIFF